MSCATEADPRELCLRINESSPVGGLFEGDRSRVHLDSHLPWRISPEPFWITPEQHDFLLRLGPALLAFNRAANLLYHQSLKGIQPEFVHEYLDAGKPERILELSRLNRVKSHQPLVLRPDLIVTADGVRVAELDSIPGGIGFTAQGFDNSSPYRCNEDSYDPRAAFIFEGVEGEIIGDHESLIMNRGAAGFELDRADDELGTPAHTLRLASSFGHSDSYQHVIEEVLMSNSMQGGTIEPRVRADMVYFEYPNNGAVFSTGSIAWCGALSHNSYDNNVSRITENVLHAFQSNGSIRIKP